ncbi:phosphotransferase [Herbidospora yilanensis]|uniref:phosphotransferase n=1 Tax=Herbidospora yilanensis TaxID=354426 RepID=UPI0007815144|nr:phosphotransferase [Herbidospora yilanensis]
MNGDLRSLIARVWEPAGDVVRVTTGEIPPGYREAERYSYTGGKLRPRGVFALHPVVVSVRADADPGQTLLVSWLTGLLGRGPLRASFSLRPERPYVWLHSRGRAVARATVGWNTATSVLAVNEAVTVSALDGHRLAPRLLAESRWQGHPVTVTSWTGRPHRQGDPAPSPQIIRDIAFSGPRSRVILGESAYWRRLRGEIAALRDAPRLATVADRLAERLERCYGDVPLTFGRWHGDLIPGNVLWSGGRPRLDGWGLSAPDVPLGFDILHWHFHDALTTRGASLHEASSAAGVAAVRLLGELGVPREARPLVAWLFLLETALRAHRERLDGSAWNPAIYPAIIHVLSEGGVYAAP